MAMRDEQCIEEYGDHDLVSGSRTLGLSRALGPRGDAHLGYALRSTTKSMLPTLEPTRLSNKEWKDYAPRREGRRKKCV
jgi:hypothetical protein